MSDAVDAELLLSAKAEMSKTDMRHIRELLELAQEKKEQIETSEECLAVLKEEHRKIIEEHLPQAMQQVGTDTFGAPDLGIDVELENKVDAKIPSKFEELAYAWLYENNYGDIIKSVLQVGFDKGESEKLKDVVELAQQAGLPVESKSTIHNATLKSFIKSLLEEGKEFPLEYFGVYQRTVAKIKQRKNKE